MTGRINRCSHCGCDEPILGIDGKLYCDNCGMSLEKLEGGLTMKTELKPCPFCGNTNIHETHCRELEECAHFEECDTDIPYFAYVCGINSGGCGASSGYYEHPEEALEAWNRRA